MWSHSAERCRNFTCDSLRRKNLADMQMESEESVFVEDWGLCGVVRKLYRMADNSRKGHQTEGR